LGIDRRADVFAVGSIGTCSKTCSVDADCGQSLACTDTGAGASVCLDPPTPPNAASSCNATAEPSDGVGRGALALGLAAVASTAVLTRRRRRSQLE
jgi:hypothetical protein